MIILLYWYLFQYILRIVLVHGTPDLWRGMDIENET